jgi:hypothetical protein
VETAELGLNLIGPGAHLLRLLLSKTEHCLAVGHQSLHVLGPIAEKPFAHPSRCGVHGWYLPLHIGQRVAAAHLIIRLAEPSINGPFQKKNVPPTAL